MSRSRFPLRAILLSRRIAQQQQQQKVAEAAREVRAAQDAVERIHDQRRAVREDLRLGLAGTVDLRSLRMAAVIEGRMARLAEHRTIERAGVARTLRTEAGELTERRRRTETLERLEEKWTRQRRAEILGGLEREREELSGLRRRPGGAPGDPDRTGGERAA